MPLESGSYISDLVATNPAHTDGLNQADSHLRLIKSALKSTFPNIKGVVEVSHDVLNAVATAFGTAGSIIIGGSAPVTLTNKSGVIASTGTIAAPAFSITSEGSDTPRDVASYLVPTGGIIVWSGAATAIPDKWVLCDGQNGTPDLRNRFIVGAAKDYNVGTTGGSTSQQTGEAGSHNHGGNTGASGGFATTVNTDFQGVHNHGGFTQPHALAVDQIPAHSHSAPKSATANVVTGSGTAVTLVEINGLSSTDGPLTSATGSGNPHSHIIAQEGMHNHGVEISQGNHSHVITADGTHTHTVNVLPPYYALCYIMKL